MQKLLLQTIFLIAGVAALGAQAQTIYRCGNSYSQIPCPGAEPKNFNDSRQPEQKSRMDAIIQNDARIAKTMEQERLAEEKRQLAGHRPIASGTPARPASTTNGITDQAPKRVQPKPGKPEAFIAEIPGNDKPVAHKRKLKTKAKKPA